MTGPGKRRPSRRKELDPARQAAFDVLRAVSERDAYANLALPAILRERGIHGRDAAFAVELTYGTCRTRGLLDAVIAHAAGRPIDRIDPVLLDLLRLGTYQLLRTRVGQHAAVSTTVEQAGIEFDTARAGFVNGVLRKIAGRDEAAWVDELAPAASSDPVGHLAFTHAHPRWIAQAFADALGADAGELSALLASDDARPDVHLAARPAALTAAELAATGRRHGRPLFAVRGVPARRRSRAARRGARRGGAGSGRRQSAGGAGVDAGATGRSRRWAMAGSVRRPRRQDGAAGRDGSGGRCRRRCHRSGTGAPPRRSGRGEHQGSAGRSGARRRSRVGPRAGLRPGARRRAVHRPGSAAPPPRGPVAPSAERCAAAGEAAARASGRGDPADQTGRCGAVRDVLAAPGRNSRSRRRRAAQAPGPGGRRPAVVRAGRGRLGAGPYVQLWPHRHGTDAMFAAALQVR